MAVSLSRRDTLKLAGLAAMSAALGPAASLSARVPARPERKRVLRIAHLTDVHVEPEKHAGEGMAACLRHVRELRDAPDLIITGGDHVFDSMATTEDRTRLQWDLWSRVLRDENRLPVLSCLGNHDCWGLNKGKSKTTGDEARYGKTWAVEALAMPGRYYSLERKGWRLVFLDSITPKGDSYIARLDDEQFEWLAGDLAATKTPTLVISHIPILSIATLDFGGKDQRDNNTVDPSLMHIDAGRLHALFLKHPHVRACISGHLHLVDRCEYDGVAYLCNGAVCGNWWKGRHRTCDEGYALVDLFDDGSVERQYVTYGWVAKP
jgi:3',5'-cyclic AMP phosphodiesterase CpdA